MIISDNEIKLLIGKEFYVIFLPDSKEFVISDSWLTDWIIVYPSGKWAHDGIFHLNQKQIDRITTFIADINKD